MSSIRNSPSTRLALRIDDIGASTKKFEVYSKRKFGNFLFLKYVPGFRAWGPYHEMTVDQWQQVLNLLRNFSAKLTVGITAVWVERNGETVPFPDKFPAQAGVIKEGWEEELLEIANHGLTHCVVGKHLPRLFSSNRKYHREFWDWVPREVHFEHIEKSQAILQDYFDTEITTLIPPGNVFSQDTIDAAQQNGIKRINCLNVGPSNGEINIIGNESVIDFHDREIVLEGTKWLKRKLESLPEHTEFVFVKEL